METVFKRLSVFINNEEVFQRSTLGSKKFIKNIYFLHNIGNCFTRYSLIF